MVDWFRRGTNYLGVRIRGLSTRLFQQTTIGEWFLWQCVCVSAKLLGLCAGTSTIPQVFGFACTGLQLSLACSQFRVWYHSFVACFPFCFIATLPVHVGKLPSRIPHKPILDLWNWSFSTTRQCSGWLEGGKRYLDMADRGLARTGGSVDVVLVLLEPR